MDSRSSSTATEAARRQHEHEHEHGVYVPTDYDMFLGTLGLVFLLVLAYQLLGLRGVSGVVANVIIVGGSAIAIVILCGFTVALNARRVADEAPSSGRAGPGARAMTVSVAWPPGMDAAAISELPPPFRFKREDAAAEGWAQCQVCVGVVRVGESVRRLPACGHLFHRRCVDQWLRGHATCPLCRTAVRREELPPV